MSNQPYNPWDVASNPPEDIKSFYGEVTINAYAGMLVTGVGKVPYEETAVDPKTGGQYRRYTVVDLTIHRLSESNLQFDLVRTMLAEFGEWRDVTWPSIKALGVMNAQELAGKFVRIEQVPTGRKYQSANGEEREATAVKFTDVFPDRATCVTAYRAEFGQQGGNGNASQQTAPASTAVNSNGNGNAEQTTAEKFVKSFVQAAMREAGNDLDKARAILGPKLAAQPLVNKFFTVDSPEVIEMMMVEVSA